MTIKFFYTQFSLKGFGFDNYNSMLYFYKRRKNSGRKYYAYY